MSFSPIVLGTGTGAYQFLARTREQQMDRLAQSPQMARDTAYFKEKVQSVETVDDLMDDRRLLRIALGAFGLEEDLNNRGFIRKVLESDINDGTSLANRLSEKKYLALARAFNFSGNARLPGADASEDVKPALRNLASAEDLFRPANARLLDRTLEVFDLQGDKGREVFLSRVMQSDLSDPTSLVNRLENKQYAALARAFQGIEPRIDASFMRSLSDDIATRLEAVETAADLVSDRGLLRAALSVFGLEDSASNTFFLRDILESDLSDPESFANRQRDTRFAELAAVFDFQARASEKNSIYGFTNTIGDKLDRFETVDDLLADTEVLDATLRVFGLEQDAILGIEPNLRAVLTSDLSDEASAANTAEDPRYAALAKVFNFAEIADGESLEEAQRNLRKMVETVEGQRTRIRTGEEFVAQAGFIVASLSFFDLPSGTDGGTRLRRVATSDANDANSLLNLVSDPRYRAFYNAMDFGEVETGRNYPRGFADALTDAYMERQFEIQVGEIDQDMRIALSLDRSLSDVVTNVKSNDARWFSVMSSTPLRKAFETALGLPTSFGNIDLDQQLEVFKARAARLFGTSEIAEIAKPETLDTLRDRFLAGISISGSATGPTLDPALVLISSAAQPQQSGYSALLGIISQG